MPDKVPLDHRPYADKYFLRANEILKAEGLNPWVNMQVFVRKGPGRIAGINEALEIILQNSNIEKIGGRIYTKKDGLLYQPKETLINIIAPAQEIIELETVYLGVIAAAMTLENDKHDLDTKEFQRNVRQVVELAGDRPVVYFGARHWHYMMDKELSKIAFDNGVKDCSTDNGAETAGKKGVGTIPHALENIYAYYFGFEEAVAKATDAFDRTMDPKIPRVALIDYANREIMDTIKTMYALGYFNNGKPMTKLSAVRIDTCGENIAEGGISDDGNNGKKYWTGKGVTVVATAVLREAMNNAMNVAGLEENIGIMLSSGFGNPEKVKAFNEGEKHFGMKLYDALGAGFHDNVRVATADIIAVGETADDVDYFINGGIAAKNTLHKTGRPPRYNKGLIRAL